MTDKNYVNQLPWRFQNAIKPGVAEGGNYCQLVPLEKASISPGIVGSDQSIRLELD